MSKRSEENTALLQDAHGLQLNPIALSRGSGPPRLARARCKVSSAFIHTNADSGNTHESRCGGSAAQIIVSRGFHGIQDLIGRAPVDTCRISKIKVLGGDR